MIAANKRVFSVLFTILAFGAGLLVTYYYVAKEANMVFYAFVGSMLFLVCFFNVRLSLILLIMSMLLSPEIGVGSTPSRDVTIRFDDILLIIVSFAWVTRVAIFKDGGLMLKNPMNPPILLYSALALVSTTLGVVLGNVVPASGFLFVLKLIEYFFLFAVVVNFIREERDVHMLLTTIFVVAGIISLYGLFQAISGGDVAAPFEGSADERNTLGGYLVLVGSIAGGVMLHTNSRSERILLGGMIAILITVLLFSLSRSSWLASMVSVIVLLFSSRNKSGFFLFIIAFLFMLPFFVPEVVQSRFEFTFSQNYHQEQIALGPYRLDTSISARLSSFMHVLRAIYKRPFFGYGITGWMFLDGQFFRTLIEMGVFGLAAFIWLNVRVHNITRSVIKMNPPPRLDGMARGFYAAFWGMMVHALSANTFIIVRIAEPFWFIAGMVVVIYMHGQDRSWYASAETDPEKYHALGRIAPWQHLAQS